MSDLEMRVRAAMAEAGDDGRIDAAMALGREAAVEGRPRCLTNGGLHEDQDNPIIHQLAHYDFAHLVALGNAWMDGYDAGGR